MAQRTAGRAQGLPQGGMVRGKTLREIFTSPSFYTASTHCGRHAERPPTRWPRHPGALEL